MIIRKDDDRNYIERNGTIIQCILMVGMQEALPFQNLV